MGGCGSGARAQRATVEATPALEITWLRKQGWLEPGTREVLRWHWRRREEETTASVLMVVPQANHVTILSRFTSHRSPPEDLRYSLTVTWTPCHYGGQRPWWICPNPTCGRRVATLYLGGKYFACRHCYGLTYLSCQASGTINRERQRIEKVREQLGLKPIPPYGFSDSLWDVERPRYLHQKTYLRLRKVLEKAQQVETRMFNQHAWALIQRSNRIRKQNKKSPMQTRG